MGVLADTVMRGGGTVIGVMPEFLVAREIAHIGITELKIVKTMHERKNLMSELSDACIAMPGGFGTTDEFCEMITWAMLDLKKAPCGLLNIDSFFDHLLKFFDHATESGLIEREHRDLILVSDSPGQLIELMKNSICKFAQT